MLRPKINKNEEKDFKKITKYTKIIRLRIISKILCKTNYEWESQTKEIATMFEEENGQILLCETTV